MRPVCGQNGDTWHFILRPAPVKPGAVSLLFRLKQSFRPTIKARKVNYGRKLPDVQFDSADSIETRKNRRCSLLTQLPIMPTILVYRLNTGPQSSPNRHQSVHTSVPRRTDKMISRYFSPAIYLAAGTIAAVSFAEFAHAASPSAAQALRLAPSQERRRTTCQAGRRAAMQDFRQEDRWACRLARGKPGRSLVEEVCRHRRRQRRRSMELLQRRCGSLSRDRHEIGRQGERIPLAQHGRHTLGRRYGGQRQDQRMEGHLRGRSPAKLSPPWPIATPTASPECC